MKRNTWQREAVRTALSEADGFISAQSLHGALRDAGTTIGLATVYRALTDLTDEGEADTLTQDGEALYRACTPDSHHHHLICRRCGATEEIEADPVETWARQVASEHGFTKAEHVVDIFGLCPACSRLPESAGNA